MAKILKRRLQVFAAYEEPFGLSALRGAEGMTISLVSDTVHLVTPVCHFSLGKFEVLNVMRELIELIDQ